MPEQQQQWMLAPAEQPPEWFVQAVKRYTPIQLDIMPPIFCGSRAFKTRNSWLW